MTKITQPSKPILNGLNSLNSLIDLTLRLWIANVFWKAGIRKITTWDTTVALFTYDYQVPFLSPEVAAFLATSVELSFPILLVLGLGTRVSAAVLFVFNFMAVISYPDLGPVGIKDHQHWGLMLLVILLHGAGRFSIDHYIKKKCLPESFN